ncbi:SGNH/GDSL hydrolase family protein [Streptomyces sp. RFCAC02]|uniref:SGNH/GDSL hydrolase family protein n=1 Tax=Streptomyces sp. RFCAC02 TaxID=2499143 RepID=UPI001021D65E|nr:SGNH/GDSL hydrolase family protein [Streptomyces sp. RFCAC02]
MRQSSSRRTTSLTRRAFGAAAAGLTGAAVAGAAATPAAAAPSAGRGGRGTVWIGTWSTAPTTVPAGDHTDLADRTVRQVVHTSIGGDRLRVRLSNEFGDAPLVVGEARVALQAASGEGTDTERGSDRTLTFGGSRSAVVPAGAPYLSDPVDLRVAGGANLVVSLHLRGPVPRPTVNAFAAEVNHIADGNATGATHVTDAVTTDRWWFLTGVQVARGAGDRASAVVALGDSITATTGLSTDHRWTDLLAERLRAARHLPDIGVLNAGISGNRLRHGPNPPAGSPAQEYAAFFGEAGLTRFDRDVAAQPGAAYVVVLLGVNDIGQPGTPNAPAFERVTAGEVIDGLRQVADRARQRGLTVIGGTIGPFRDTTLGFHTPENEAARLAVNRWIRTGGAYDAVADFDAAVRDPARPDRLLPAYDSGDHLHLNDTGNRAMADAVDLRVFR